MPSRCATTADTFGIDASVLQVATMTRSMSPGDRPLPASALAPASKAMSVTVSSGPAYPPLLGAGALGSSGQQLAPRRSGAANSGGVHDDRGRPKRVLRGNVEATGVRCDYGCKVQPPERPGPAEESAVLALGQERAQA